MIEFGEWDDQVNAGLWRRLREWLIGQFGQDTADKVIPGYDVGTLEEFARQESAAETQPLPAFSESNTPPATTLAPQSVLRLRVATMRPRRNPSHRSNPWRHSRPKNWPPRRRT